MDDPNKPPDCDGDHHFEGSYYGGQWMGRCKINSPCEKGYHAIETGAGVQCARDAALSHPGLLTLQSNALGFGMFPYLVGTLLLALLGSVAIRGAVKRLFRRDDP